MGVAEAKGVDYRTVDPRILQRFFYEDQPIPRQIPAEYVPGPFGTGPRRAGTGSDRAGKRGVIPKPQKMDGKKGSVQREREVDARRRAAPGPDSQALVLYDPNVAKKTIKDLAARRQQREWKKTGKGNLKYNVHGDIPNPAVEPEAINATAQAKRSKSIASRRQGRAIDAAEAKSGMDLTRMSQDQLQSVLFNSDPTAPRVSMNNAPPGRIGPFSNSAQQKRARMYNRISGEQARGTMRRVVIEPIAEIQQDERAHREGRVKREVTRLEGLNQRQALVYDLGAAEAKEAVSYEPDRIKEEKKVDPNEELLRVQEDLDEEEAKEFARVQRENTANRNRSGRLRYTPGKTKYTTETYRRKLEKLKDIGVKSRRTHTLRKR